MGCQGSKGVQPGSAKKQSVRKSATKRDPKKTLLAATETAEEKQKVSELSTPNASVAQGSPALPGINNATLSDSVIANRTNNSIMLRDQCTRCTDRTELELMVMKFSCRDGPAGDAMESTCKEMQWIVGYDRKADPIDIKLHVQQHDNDVRIESNGEPIFQGASENTMAKMLEDFCYQWPLRANIHGISKSDFFECRAPDLMADSWFPATVLSQRDDGLFEVSVLKPSSSSQLMELNYLTVDKTSLREASTGNPVIVPEAALTLEVPKQSPLSATLKVANGKRVSMCFGRSQKRELRFQVSKDRSTITADVGHGTLANLASGEVQSIKSDTDRLRHMWAFQLGPFAEHTVEVCKNDTADKLITLRVDGEIMVEATPTDIGCHGSDWQFSFRFVGECVMDFEVVNANPDGTSSDVKDHVIENRRYVYECMVLLPSDTDFSSAELFIDDVSFANLPVKAQSGDEQALATDPSTLQRTYGITIPHEIHDNQHDSMEQGDAGKGVSNRFAGFMCCAASSAVKDDIVVH
jgi:hypothetical protein